MFKDVISKGRIWADKMATVVLNYSDLEAKVRDETTDEPWGPHGRVMDELAEETYSYEALSEIMNMLWCRIFPENPRCWRRILKGLTILAHLLRNGSERVLDFARDHVYNLRTLDNYQCIDERGRDVGSGVRQKAKEVVELIQDVEFLNSERQKARRDRKEYRGFGNTTYDYDNSYNKNYYDTQEDDSYHFPKRNQPAEVPRDSSQPITSQLGSFDSWKAGRERSIGDEVIDKVTSVMRVAKVVTDDFLGKPRVPPPSMYETNPHQVSEDVFTFSNAEVEDASGQTEEDRRYQERYSAYHSNEQSFHSDSPQHFPQPKKSSPSVASPKPAQPAPTSLIDFDPTEGAQQTKTASNGMRIPRPPSVERLNASPGQSVSQPMAGKQQEDFDFFADFDNSRQQLPINGRFPDPPTPAPSTTSNGANFSASPDLFAGLTGNQAPVKPQTAADAFDTEFGDFAAATPSKVPSPNLSQAPVATQSGPALVTNAFYTQPSSPSVLQHSKINSTAINHSLPTPQKSPAPTIADIADPTPSIVGKTWKDFESLSLDLDLRAKPTLNKPNAPSLVELQKQKNASAVSHAGAFVPLAQPKPSSPFNFSDFGAFK